MFINEGVAIIREYPKGTIFKRKKDNENMYVPVTVVSPDTIRELVISSKMLHKKLYRLMKNEANLNDVDKDALERTKTEIFGIADRLQVSQGELENSPQNIKPYVILEKKVIQDLDKQDILRGRESDTRIKIEYEDFIKNYFVIV